MPMFLRSTFVANLRSLPSEKKNAREDERIGENKQQEKQKNDFVMMVLYIFP